MAGFYDLLRWFLAWRGVPSTGAEPFYRVQAAQAFVAGGAAQEVCL
jgi:hypothetical protein